MGRKRNSQRTGTPTLAPAEDNTSPATMMAQGGDLLSFVTPTEFVDLPSQGRFYPAEHPLAGKDTVEIRHMTAKEEDILMSESLLRKGLALDRMLQSLLVDTTLNIDEFLVGDKNALTVAARTTGFGSMYITNLTCPSCAAVNETEFDLDTLELHTATELPEEISATDHGTFIFQLPTTGVHAEVRLLTATVEKQMAEATLKKKKLNLPDTRSTDLLKAVLVSLNGVEDPSVIHQFVDLMPVKDSRYLRTLYEQVKPDIDLTHAFICEDCSYAGEVTMPLTAQFFWPNI
jgi:hypothetical protein